MGKQKKQTRNFIPLPISEFMLGFSAPVNLYVKLSEAKFILVIKAGEKATRERLLEYENKDVSNIWVIESEYNKLTKQTVIIAGIAFQKKQLSASQKTKFLTNAASSVFREFEHIGLNEHNFKDAKKLTETTFGLVEAHDGIHALLVGLEDCNDEIVRHGLAVSALSLMIAKELNWTSQQTLEKLSLGCLLIDIGLKQLPKELSLKSKLDMSPEEIHLFETHPFRGMEMALELGSVPDDVVSIIFEHEENSIGTGYPRRIRGLKMHPMSRVVSLANTYVRMVMPSALNKNPKGLRETLVYLETTMGMPHNKEAFEALKAIVSQSEFKVTTQVS